MRSESIYMRLFVVFKCTIKTLIGASRIPWIENPVPWIENPAFPAPFFVFQIKKNAVNWTVEPGQKRLNQARIGYIDIKRYFRAIYLHK